MAYTFAEVFSQSQPANATDRPVVICTLVVTQEDGRAAWGEGTLSINHSATELELADNVIDDLTMKLYFNDRGRFSGSPDLMTMKIVAAAIPNSITVQLNNRSWNARSSVTLSSYSATKLYIGGGGTIGDAPGQALHSLSFIRLDRHGLL